MAKRNIKGLQEYGKQRTIECEKKVLDTIEEMRKSKHTITVASVARAAGISPNFIYTHKDILETIRKYSPASGRKTIQSQDSKDALINSLRMENRALKKELAKLESREKYEEKYLQAEKQIEQLKKELEKMILGDITNVYKDKCHIVAHKPLASNM